MAQGDVEIFRRGVDAWNRDDYEVWIALMDPQVEWTTFMEVYRGHSGVRKAWESFKQDAHVTVRFDDVRELHGSVLALGTIQTSGRTTGLSFSGELAQLVTYRNGKTVTLRDFASHADALAAVPTDPSGPPVPPKP